MAGDELGGLLLDFDGVDAGLRRRGMTQRVEKGVQRGTLALHLDPHRAGIVADPTAQLAAAGHLIDEGAKSDPLHDAAHGDGQATHGRSGWRGFATITGPATGGDGSIPLY